MQSQLNTPETQATAWTRKLSHRIVARIGSVLIFLSIGVALLTFMSMRTIALAELQAKGDALADTLNFSFETMLGQHTLASLQRVADNSTSIEDIHKVAIVDLHGTIIVSSNRSEMARGQTRSATVQAFLNSQASVPESHIVGNHLVIIHPLRGNQFAVRPGDNITGAVEVVMDTNRAETKARDAALRILAITLGSYILLSLTLGFFVHKLVGLPVKRLTWFAERFRSGDHAVRSQIDQRDEIGLLSATFNHMADEVDRIIQHLELRTDELCTEIGQRQEVEHRLREREDLLSTIYQVVDVGICVTTDTGSIVQINQAACQIFGVESATLIGQPISSWLADAPAPGNRTTPAAATPTSREWHIHAGDGQQRHVWATTRSFHRANGECFIVTALTDITNRKRMEAQLYHLATHDGLTDLPNRNHFLDQMADVVGREPCAVLFFDLDKFKVINDSLGHLTGDQVLIEMSRRLTRCLPSDVMLARFGGDEFLVFLHGEQSGQHALDVAACIHETLRVPLLLNQQELVLSASIGVALAPLDADGPPTDLIRNANIAMYQAKERGRAMTCVYDEAMDAQALSHLQTQIELRQALQEGAIVLHYQPIMSLTDGRVVGFEALARWHHPERGLLLAGSFVPIAEESGLIVAFDWHMLRQACLQAATLFLPMAAQDALVIHVNISGLTFLHPGLVEHVAAALAESGLPPACLVLEITETVAMDQADTTIHTLHQIQALGVGVALDDFGIGYSSLRYLQQFPVQAIKIDASFVRTMEQDSGSAAIIETILSLAETLHLQVVAEGIETEAQHVRLQKLQCGSGQGKYFSWAVEANTAAALLVQHRVLHQNDGQAAG